MSIFEAIGMAWVIFTSAVGSIAVIYLSYAGLRVALGKDLKESQRVNVPVKGMFKIAR